MRVYAMRRKVDIFAASFDVGQIYSYQIFAISFKAGAILDMIAGT